jgi:hypothetical protein
VRDGETTPEDVLVQDAVGAAVECRAVFDRLAASGGAPKTADWNVRSTSARTPW